MNDPEITEIFAFARSLWPHDVAPGSEAVRLAWGNSLRRVEDPSLLATVLVGMAEHHPKFPSLAVLLEAYGLAFDQKDRARKSAEAAAAFRLEPPAPSPVEKTLASFDASARSDREKRHRELALFVASHGEMSGSAVATRERQIDEIGYCEQRARAMLERGFSPGDAGKELFHSLSEAIANLKRPMATA